MINSVKQLHLEHFGSKAAIFTQAPGRINLIGEHTDYNDGLVLPAAIDKYIFFAFSKNKNASYNFRSLDLNEHINISELKKSDKHWANYLIGIVHTLREEGFNLSGFDCTFGGNIPIGAGISSSAALECGFVAGINQLFELKLGRMQMVAICKKSDNNFLQIQSGMLDQFASLFGKRNQAVRLDCRSKEYQYFPLKTEKYKFLLINTNVEHSHIDGEYNDRPTECIQAVNIIQKKYPKVVSLRDVNSEILSSLQSDLGLKLYNRVHFILNENERVLRFCKALVEANYGLLGDLLYESHNGLSEQYEVSCPELDFLVETSRPISSILGARMMGGGFGGCTLNLIEKSAIPNVKSIIREAYFEKFGIAVDFYEVKTSDGVHWIQNNSI